MCKGFCAMDKSPSPNVQSQEEVVPLEIVVKSVNSLLVPKHAVLTLKSARGDSRKLIVTISLSGIQPKALELVKIKFTEPFEMSRADGI